MGVTVSAINMTTIQVHKGSGSNIVAFPDTCFTPASPQPFVPAPFPGTASGSAAKTPVTKPPTAGVAMKGTAFSASTGIEAGAASLGPVSTKSMGKSYFMMGSSNVVYEGAAIGLGLGAPATNNAANDKNTAIAKARTRMSELHGQLLNKASSSPASWHAILDEYVKAVSSLYILLNLK